MIPSTGGQVLALNDQELRELDELLAGANEDESMTLEEFDGFAWIPFLAVLLLKQWLVVPHVDVAGGAGHEELDDALGFGRGVEDATSRCGGEE